MDKSVLIIAAHPDDELLGSGGTLKKLINHGYKVITVIVAKGRKEEEHDMTRNIERANKHLGIEEVVFLEYPNLLLETIPLHVLNKEIEALLVKYEPSIIFTHHYGDINLDHQILFQAVLTATRPLPQKILLNFFALKQFHLVNGVNSQMTKSLNLITMSILQTRLTRK